MRRLLLLLALLLLPSLTLAREGWRGFCEDGNQSVVTSGISSSTKVQRSFPQCTVTIFVHGGALATIFADNNGTPLANPFQANLDGSFIWYANDGRYDQQISGSNLAAPFTFLDILLCDPFVPGAVCSGAAAGAHNLLSTTHLDTIPFSPPVRGDLIVAQNLTSPSSITPAWARLPLGTSGQVLMSTSTDAIWGTLTAGNGITVNNVGGTTTITNNFSGRHGLLFSIGVPGASALTVASTTTAYIVDVPFACTITRYALGIDAGTITVKFWKIATGGTSLPTSANSINTSGVGVSSGTLIQSPTLSDFTTTAVAKDDVLAMNVTAVSSAAYVTGVLTCQE